MLQLDGYFERYLITPMSSETRSMIGLREGSKENVRFFNFECRSGKD